MSDTPIYDQLKREYQLREMIDTGMLRYPNIRFDPSFLTTMRVHAERPLDVLDSMMLSADMSQYPSLKRFAQRYLRRPIKWDDPEEFRR